MSIERDQLSRSLLTFKSKPCRSGKPQLLSSLTDS